jgi:hypothetical protein
VLLREPNPDAEPTSERRVKHGRRPYDSPNALVRSRYPQFTAREKGASYAEPTPTRTRYILPCTLGKREGSQRTHSPTPLPPTFGETVQAPEGGNVENLFYPAMLYSLG